MNGNYLMIRRVSSLATFLFLLFTLITIINSSLLGDSLMAHANPIEETYLSAAPTVYVAGTLDEVFTIDINISNVQNLYAFEFKLGYNTTLLDAVQVVQGPFFPPPPQSSVDKLEINETMGFVWVSISLSGSENTRNDSGTLAVITFNVAYAPQPPEKACCVLDLHDSALYDNATTPIAHESLDGLYFWKSAMDDPPIGLLLDLWTQKGGVGPGESGGVFTLGEIVDLLSYLTYNEYPVQNKLVSFGVLDPNNEVILVRVAVTDHDGRANISFRIPSIPESIGTWTAVAVASVAENVTWDFVTFVVTHEVPPHGPKADFTETPQSPYVNETVRFDASTSLPGWNGTHEMPIIEYRWDFGDDNKTTVSVPMIDHGYESAGVYNVTLTVYAPGATPETESVTHWKVVREIPPPVVGGNIVLFKNTHTSSGFPTQETYLLAAIMISIISLVAIIRRQQGG